LEKVNTFPKPASCDFLPLSILSFFVSFSNLFYLDFFLYFIPYILVETDHKASAYIDIFSMVYCFLYKVVEALNQLEGERKMLIQS